MAHLIMLPVLFLVMISTVAPQTTTGTVAPQTTTGPLYPTAQNVAFGPRDDGSSPSIELKRPFIYFGEIYRNIYINVNGHLTFEMEYDEYDPLRFPLYGSFGIIAPFWTDLNSMFGGAVYSDQYTNGSVLQQATEDINEYFPGLNFTASWVLVATWDDVPFYSYTSKTATFQAVLISGDEYSFLLLNYGMINSIPYDVQAGYDTVNSTHHFILPGSFARSTPTDSPSFHLSSNVNETGRWAFKMGKGCSFNGDLILPGTSFWSDRTCAQKCDCTSEGLKCHDQPCPYSQICQPSVFQFSCQTVQRATCRISGDPHYSTYDGKLFDFQGTCTYILSEQCRHELPYFRVEGKNEHWSSTKVSWTRLVKVYVYNQTIELVIGHQAKAKVNGLFAATPIFLSNGAVHIYESGVSVIISTDFGLEVSYDFNHLVRIRVPYTYKNATCGLCGDFNDDPEDDFRTRQGMVVSSGVVFVNSWQASGNNETGCDEQCGGLDCAACTENQTVLYSNTDHCGILKNNTGPFADCNKELDPKAFVGSCVYDLCVGGGYQPILCQALDVYASQCQLNGLQLKSWRTQDFCEIPCPFNSHYELQGTGCPATCAKPNSTHNCLLPAQESCICNSGYILSAGVCVPLAECGCSFEGRYYRSGETVILDEDCGRRCSCGNGQMQCESQRCDPLESCMVVEGERGCRANSYASCLIRSPGLYQTFDGYKYQYPGACRLTLVKTIGSSGHPSFMATSEKVPVGQKGFAQVLKFEAEGTHIAIEMTGSINVKVDGQHITLPFSSASNQIRIYHSNIHSIMLQTSFGVTVQIVWPHLVRITAPGIYNGSLGGLCGDNNGHPHDDFRTPNGMLVNSSREFGDSWRDGSLTAHCVESAHPNSTSNYDASEDCGIIGLTDGPFAPCLAIVNTEKVVNACSVVLKGSGDPARALCEVLQDFAVVCQLNNVALGDWRNATKCERACPPNSHFEQCGSSCPSTCPSLSFPLACNTVCTEGCQCDDGFVLNGNQCMPPTACGCYHQGRYRQAGEKFWDDKECQSLCSCNGKTGAVHCNPDSCESQESCRVVGGEFGCHPNPHGMCSVSGGHHYLTFDRKAYDFQGTCHYVLANVCNATDERSGFSVEVKNEPLSGFDVFVNIGGHQVRMSSDRSGMIEVNRINHNVPVVLNESRVLIFARGSRTFVIADFGLSVTFDGRSTVSISVPSNYSGQTCGLCGNFNGNSKDDFHTPSGLKVTTVQEFGTSWKVAGNPGCDDGCGSSCPQCPDEMPARAQCEVIRAADGPFSFCHDQVDPAPYFNDCVFDVCTSGNEGQDILCAAIQAYVSACQSANVRIYPWRQNNTCRPDCPANSHYELCGTDCGHTCASGIDAICEQVCSEGCFCNDGFLKSGTLCVPVESCGCLHDGFYYNAGESFLTEGCSQRCECQAPNSLNCSATSCSPPHECTVKGGQRGCFDPMSTCTVWGDQHYLTFDGAQVQIQGTCSHIITESVGTSETRFQVVATNKHRGNNLASFVSVVDIYLSTQQEDAHIRIGTNKIVKVNESEVSLPTTVGTLAQLQRQGSFAVVKTNDLIVHFDGRSTLLVQVANTHQNRIRGMCGNLNSDPTDDKVFPNGTLAQNDNEFGYSWKAPTSQPGCESMDNEPNNCPRMEEYSQLCSIITNSSGPFAACHQQSDPQPFFNSCVSDLCRLTSASGTLCSVVSAYQITCLVSGLSIPGWRNASQCAESDPCKDLDCREHEWCGKKDGVYDCLCDENHQRPASETYESTVTCAESSAYITVSRCQLFEDGFHSSALHLQDESCKGQLQDGRLLFHFNNDDQLCGTGLKSNGTHFIYENSIQGHVDPNKGPISRRRDIKLDFLCAYPLTQSVSMDVGIRPIESMVNRNLPSANGSYRVRIVPYQDPEFKVPLTSERNLEIEISERLFMEVRLEGVDEHQISIVLDSCWATPIDNASFHIRWDLISHSCPNPADDSVEILHNGGPLAARFSFKMFTFIHFSSIYLHCKVHLCLLENNNCITDCSPDSHTRRRRDVTYHDTTDISVGPLVLTASGESRGRREVSMEGQTSASGQLTSMVILLLSLLTATTLT